MVRNECSSSSLLLQVEKRAIASELLDQNYSFELSHWNPVSPVIEIGVLVNRINPIAWLSLLVPPAWSISPPKCCGFWDFDCCGLLAFLAENYVRQPTVSYPKDC
jgi:hypothetical protein